MSVIPFVENPTGSDLTNIGLVRNETTGTAFGSRQGSPQLNIARILNQESYESFVSRTIGTYDYCRMYVLWVTTRPTSENKYYYTNFPYTTVVTSGFSNWNVNDYIVGWRYYVSNAVLEATGIFADNSITTYNAISDWISNENLIRTTIYPITYHYTNSTVTGPSSAAVGDTVTVSAVPDVGYGITDATTQILVTNDNVAVPYTWDAATNHITFTMPQPAENRGGFGSTGQ